MLIIVIVIITAIICRIYSVTSMIMLVMTVLFMTMLIVLEVHGHDDNHNIFGASRPWVMAALLPRTTATVSCHPEMTKVPIGQCAQSLSPVTKVL